MSAPVLRIGDRELTVIEGQPRIRDTDLGAWLGFERPRDIRKLIERWSSAPEGSSGSPPIAPIGRATVARSFSGRGRKAAHETPVTEYWLTRAEAVFLIVKSETSRALALTDHIIEVFLAAKGMLAPPPPSAPSLPGGPPPEELPVVALENRFSFLAIETREELLDEIEGMAAICRRAPMALQVAIARQLGSADSVVWAACRAELLAGLGQWAAEYGGTAMNTNLRPETRETSAHFAEQLACLLARAVRLLSD